jgi:malonate-semialdehyde dehydrogenase (acetylating)/methylmalonate-semialdehyde dehydrogenase
MGPLITGEHRDRVASYVRDANQEGAKVVVDGTGHPLSQSAGFFLGTSLLDEVKPGMRCYDDEMPAYANTLSALKSKALSQRRCGNKVTLPGYQQFH